MRALRCDVCKKFFDPIEDGNKYKKVGECTTNRFGLCESCDGGHRVIKVIDVCHDCVTKMFEAVDFKVSIEEDQNGNEI